MAEKTFTILLIVPGSKYGKTVARNVLESYVLAFIAAAEEMGKNRAQPPQHHIAMEEGGFE